MVAPVVWPERNESEMWKMARPVSFPSRYKRMISSLPLVHF